VIRLANKFDNKIILDALLKIQRAGHNRSKTPDRWSFSHVEKQMAHIYAGMGFALVSDDGSGALVAVKVPQFWIPNSFILHEVLWFADSKRVSLALLKEYIRIGKEMPDILEIHLTSYQDADFSRYGAVRCGHRWVI
jgi:hypothetical protein